MRGQKKTAEEVANEIFHGRSQIRDGKETGDVFYDNIFLRVKNIHPNNQQKRSAMFDEVVDRLRAKGIYVHS